VHIGELNSRYEQHPTLLYALCSRWTLALSTGDIAVATFCRKLLVYLLEKSTDIRMPTVDGHALLYIAAIQYPDAVLTKKLLELGADFSMLVPAGHVTKPAKKTPLIEYVLLEACLYTPGTDGAMEIAVASTFLSTPLSGQVSFASLLHAIQAIALVHTPAEYVERLLHFFPQRIQGPLAEKLYTDIQHWRHAPPARSHWEHFFSQIRRSPLSLVQENPTLLLVPEASLEESFVFGPKGEVLTEFARVKSRFIPVPQEEIVLDESLKSNEGFKLGNF